MQSESKITLLGAGPGDPDLISIRGVNALKTADVVLYDALVHPDLLKYAPDYSLKIFVGKRAGHHYCTQNEINKKLVEFAQLGHVVRLKGGDPFVFGRGFEELEYAQNQGIPIEIIPGMSSATAVSSWIGLPITLRNVSRSFHVVTAVGEQGKLSKDFIQATQLEGTVVILMGLKKLYEIVETYKILNKGQLGIAVIQNGTLTHQKVAIGTINNIQRKVAQSGITTPAIIYIGEVVNAFLKNPKFKNHGTKKSIIPGVFQA